MKNIIFIISSILLIACKKIDVQKTDTKVPVVEAYIVPGQNDTIKVTYQLDFKTGDTIVRGYENLNILLSVGNKKEQAIYRGGGIYENTLLKIHDGDTVKLSFAYNDLTISSETIIPSKPVGFKLSVDSIVIESPSSGSGMPGPGSSSESIAASWENPKNDYYIILIKNIEKDPVPIDTMMAGRKMMFRNEPLQTNYYSLGTRNFNYYGNYQVILYHLNAEYAELYKNNGNSSLNITLPTTNIVNGLGIFTGINADTLYLKVVQ